MLVTLPDLLKVIRRPDLPFQWWKLVAGLAHLALDQNGGYALPGPFVGQSPVLLTAGTFAVGVAQNEKKSTMQTKRACVLVDGGVADTAKDIGAGVIDYEDMLRAIYGAMLDGQLTPEQSHKASRSPAYAAAAYCQLWYFRRDRTQGAMAANKDVRRRINLEVG